MVGGEENRVRRVRVTRLLGRRLGVLLGGGVEGGVILSRASRLGAV